jgi:hypothetical protein
MLKQNKFIIVLKAMENFKFSHITFPPKTFLSNNKLANNALKFFKYFNIFFKMSSLLKTYLHEL